MMQESTIENTIEDFRSKRIGSLIYASMTGSHLHGSSSEKSDIDIKGIFVPSVESLMLREVNDHIQYKFIDKGKLHEVTFISVQEFLDKILRMESNTVELLFSMDSDKVITSGPMSKYLRQQAEKLLTKNVSSFLGMANAEIKRFNTQKQRNSKKDIAHGVRSVMQARELLENGKLEFPIPRIEMITRIKYGDVTPEDGYNLINLLFEVLVNPNEKPTKEQIALKKEIILKLYQFNS